MGYGLALHHYIGTESFELLVPWIANTYGTPAALQINIAPVIKPDISPLVCRAGYQATEAHPAAKRALRLPDLAPGWIRPLAAPQKPANTIAAVAAARGWPSLPEQVFLSPRAPLRDLSLNPRVRS